jgi:hypothetical protein
VPRKKRKGLAARKKRRAPTAVSGERRGGMGLFSSGQVNSVQNGGAGLGIERERKPVR